MSLSQRGNSAIIIIILILIVGLIGFVGLQPGGFLSKKIIQGVPSQESTTPITQWLTFKSTDPSFSLKYPNDWVYEKRGEGNADNILALTFTPKGEELSQVNNVTLRVLEKKGSLTVQDWVSTYTTSYEQDDKRIIDKPYVLFKVKDIQNSTIKERDVIHYTMETIAGGKAKGTIVASDKNIFVFLGLEGKAEQTRMQMVESLEF